MIPGTTRPGFMARRRTGSPQGWRRGFDWPLVFPPLSHRLVYSTVCPRSVLTNWIEPAPQRATAINAFASAAAASTRRSVRGQQRRIGPTCNSSAHPVVPANSIRADSRDEVESAHHPARCLRSSGCLGRLSLICSGRGGCLKREPVSPTSAQYCPEACAAPSAA
jgi:hypothetical protein